jgi:hypothetical protein
MSSTPSPSTSTSNNNTHSRFTNIRLPEGVKVGLPSSPACLLKDYRRSAGHQAQAWSSSSAARPGATVNVTQNAGIIVNIYSSGAGSSNVNSSPNPTSSQRSSTTAIANTARATASSPPKIVYAANPTCGCAPCPCAEADSEEEQEVEDMCMAFDLDELNREQEQRYLANLGERGLSRYADGSMGRCPTPSPWGES